MAAAHTAPAPRIDPAEPGSAVQMHHAVPGRKHPAEVVLAALLAARPVTLPDGGTYRLGEDLTLGIGSAEQEGFILARDLPLGEFLRLCERMSFNDLFMVGCDTALAQLGAERRRRRSGPAA
ncbi:MAG TPA: hypothetical protein VF746_14700 [Longimicrobium sp.]